MPLIEVSPGKSPVILAFPHTGTWVPDDILANLNAEGRKLRDTDWHIHQLYQGLLPDATTVRATFHRYCIDANRDPSGASLYPGQNTTGFIPLTDFDNNPLWVEGKEPDEAETAARIEQFHGRYHSLLQKEINRVRREQGVAIVYDCHSIRSVCPFLFDGKLPDFNIGTDNGRTCAPEIERAVADICGSAEGYTSVVNGRFRGGWTTRHYGQPKDGVHAIQMELTQYSHLADEKAPFTFDYDKAHRLRLVLADVLTTVERIAKTLRIPKGRQP